jgi:hypothetical protein
MSSTSDSHLNAMSDGASRHIAGVSMNGSLTVSLVAVSLVFIAVAFGSFAVLASVFGGGIHDGLPKEVIDDLVAKHEQSTSDYMTRFNERYIFFKPPPKPAPPRPVVDTPPPPPPPPVDTTPKAPVTYQGPSIAWVIGDDVYFNLVPATATEKYMRLRSGDERNGLKVLNTQNVPRSVRVAHMGGEYDVKVFGDSMATTSLFPTAPKPSILIPGFIPAGEPLPPSADAPITADADGEDDGIDPESGDDPNASTQLNATPANGVDRSRGEGRPRGRGARGEGRNRPERAPDDEGETSPGPDESHANPA